MADNETRYIIAFGGDDTNILAVSDRVKSRVRSDLAEIQANANRLDLFGTLQKQVEASAAAVAKARANFETLVVAIAAIKAAGGNISVELNAGLKLAQTELNAATREAARNEAALGTLQAKLKAAGVDTSNLAAEQTRLAGALKTAQAAAEVQAAKFALNSKSLADIQPEITKLVAAYETLRSSGTLSTTLLAEAETVLNQKTGALLVQVSGFGKAARAAGVDTETLGATMRAAGINTTTLAAEQARLAESFKLSNAEALLQSTAAKSVAAEIAKLQAAYRTLVASGASLGELSAAQATLKTRTTELNAEVGTLGGALNDVKGKLLAFAVAGYTAIQFLKDARQAANDFNLAITRVGSVSDISKEQLKGLADGVRQIATSLGEDVGELTASLYEILRSGVSPENALTVLAASADTAKAALTDMHSTTTVGTLLLKAYGVSVGELKTVFDQLYQGQRDGGATLTELAGSLGNLLPVAKAAHVPLDVLIASIQTMVKAGLDAPTAINALQKVLTKLDTKTASDNLAKFGIQINGLYGTLQQIAAKGLDLNQLLDLGIGDARSIKGLAALTEGFAGLNTEIARIDASSGAIDRFNKVLDETPEEKVSKFKAAIKDLSVTVGDFVGTGTAALVPLTNLINAFNALPPSVKSAQFEIVAIVAGIGGMYAALLTAQVGINLLARAIPGLNTGFGGLITGISGSTLAIRGLSLGVAGLMGYKLGDWLRENSEAARFFGDALVLSGAAIANYASFRIKEFIGDLTNNQAALAANRAEYERTARSIASQFSDAVSGANERVRQAAIVQAQLAASLKAARDAAVGAGGAVKDAVDAMAAAVQTSLGVADQRIAQITTRLQTLTDQITADGAAAEAASRQALASIAAETAARLAALDQGDAAEAARAQATLKIEMDAAAARLDVITSNAANMLAAQDAEATARLQVAIRNKEDLTVVEQQILVAKRDTLAKIVADYQVYIANLVAQENAYLAKVKAIQDQRLAINSSIEDKLRALARESLSTYGQYQDRLAQIDENNQKARTALLAGNFKLAEDYAAKAIAQTDALGKEIKDDTGIVVSATKARTDAEDKYTESLAIVNKVFDQREQAERDGATATANAIAAAKTGYGDLKQQLSELQQKAAQGIVTKLDADTTKVYDALSDLDSALANKQHLLVVKADITQAQEAIVQLQEDLAAGITINVEALSGQISSALKAATSEAPELQLKTDEALKLIDDLGTKVAELRNVKVTLETNAEAAVAEAKAQLSKLNDIITHSKHYVEVVQLPPGQLPPVSDTPASPLGFARGGLAQAREQAQALIRRAQDPSSPLLGRVRAFQATVQAFNSGGPVFRGKVPGVGNADTYHAQLEGGSYVLKKKASAYYGDGLLAKLQGFATGGLASTLPSVHGLPRVDRTARGPIVLGDSTGVRAVAIEATKIIDPLFTAAKTLPRASAGQNAADYLNAVLQLIYDATDAATAQALLDPIKEAAGAFAAAIKNAHDAHVPLIMGASAIGGDSKSGPLPGLLNSDVGNKALAAGGDVGTAKPKGKDTIPAMLTPGEHVIRPERVSELGVGLMYALNDMKFSKEALAQMLEGPKPPVRRYFAEGGPVPTASGAVPGRATIMPVSESVAAGATTTVNHVNHIHLEVSAADVLSPENLQRHLVPFLDNLTRRKR